MGLSKKDIIKHFVERIAFLEEEDSLVLIDKKGYQEKVIGVLYFEKDKLIYGSKHWGDYEGFQRKELARTLFSLFKNLEEEGQNSAEIIVKSNREPQHDVHSIQLVFGEKHISNQVFDGKMSPPNLSIKEELGKKKLPHKIMANSSDSRTMAPSKNSNFIVPGTTTSTTTTTMTTTTTITSMKPPRKVPILVNEESFYLQ